MMKNNHWDLPEYRKVPADCLQKSDRGGKVECIEYSIVYNGSEHIKHACVYLPGEQPAEGVEYDVLYLMHGAGGNADTYFGGAAEDSPLKNLLDNMIDKNELKPLIVVTPTFSVPGSTDEPALIREFQHELEEKLIPLVDEKYCTKPSRDHRAFDGFSIGSVTTWYAFIHHLRSFRYFIPMSGDCWALGIMGGKNKPGETAAFLAEAVKASGYDSADFFIYTATGSNDRAEQNETPQIEAMKKFGDPFIYGNNMDTSNLYYMVVEGASHKYSAVNNYLYNILPGIF